MSTHLCVARPDSLLIVHCPRVRLGEGRRGLYAREATELKRSKEYSLNCREMCVRSRRRSDLTIHDEWVSVEENTHIKEVEFKDGDKCSSNRV